MKYYAHNILGFQEHKAEEEQPYTNKHVVCDAIFMKLQEQAKLTYSGKKKRTVGLPLGWELGVGVKCDWEGPREDWGVVVMFCVLVGFELHGVYIFENSGNIHLKGEHFSLDVNFM